MSKPQKDCGLKNCSNPLGPGAADVGYESEGGVRNVRVCSEHAWKIMIAERGTWRIEKDRKGTPELKPIPAKRIIL